MGEPAAIEVEELERRFGDFMAVDRVSLHVAKGEIYGFLGPNGAGKSTMVRILCTLLKTSAGRAAVGANVRPQGHHVEAPG